MKNEKEFRSITLNLSNEDYIVEGYATTFDKPYLLYEFEGRKFFEKVDRNAFFNCDFKDVIFQYDHSGNVLARTKNNTLILKTDEHGLKVRADLSKSEKSRQLFEEIKSGLTDKMSFGFIVEESSYNEKTRTRTILKIKKLFDVSAVSIPANDSTEIVARNFIDLEKIKNKKIEVKRKLLNLSLGGIK